MANATESTGRPPASANVFERLRAFESSQGATDIALLVLRAVLAVVFIGHGSQKLFGAFDGFGIDGTGQFFASIGITPGEFWATVAGVVELGAGVLLAVGLLVPLAAVLLLAEMLVATVKYNWGNGFFTETPDSGFEINLILAGMALAVTILGGGRVSLDRLLGLAGSRARDPR